MDLPLIRDSADGREIIFFDTSEIIVIFDGKNSPPCKDPPYKGLWGVRRPGVSPIWGAFSEVRII